MASLRSILITGMMLLLSIEKMCFLKSKQSNILGRLKIGSFLPFTKLRQSKNIVFIFQYKIQNFILVSSEVYHNPSIPDNPAIFKEGITMESLQFKKVLIVIVFITLLALIIKALIDFLQIPIFTFLSALVIIIILFVFLVFLNLLSK